MQNQDESTAVLSLESASRHGEESQVLTTSLTSGEKFGGNEAPPSSERVSKPVDSQQSGSDKDSSTERVSDPLTSHQSGSDTCMAHDVTLVDTAVDSPSKESSSIAVGKEGDVKMDSTVQSPSITAGRVTLVDTAVDSPSKESSSIAVGKEGDVNMDSAAVQNQSSAAEAASTLEENAASQSPDLSVGCGSPVTVGSAAPESQDASGGVREDDCVSPVMLGPAAPESEDRSGEVREDDCASPVVVGPAASEIEGKSGADTEVADKEPIGDHNRDSNTPRAMSAADQLLMDLEEVDAQVEKALQQQTRRREALSLCTAAAADSSTGKPRVPPPEGNGCHSTSVSEEKLEDCWTEEDEFCVAQEIVNILESDDSSDKKQQGGVTEGTGEVPTQEEQAPSPLWVLCEGETSPRPEQEEGETSPRPEEREKSAVCQQTPESHDADSPVCVDGEQEEEEHQPPLKIQECSINLDRIKVPSLAGSSEVTTDPQDSALLRCSPCDKSFQLARSLRRHNALVHHTEPVCTNRPCCRIFQTHEQLAEHAKVCVSRKKVQVQQPAPEITKAAAPEKRLENGSGWRCDVCHKVLAGGVRRHKAEMHNTEPLAYCRKCRRFIEPVAKFRKHMLVCGKVETAAKGGSEPPKKGSKGGSEPPKKGSKSGSETTKTGSKQSSKVDDSEEGISLENYLSYSKTDIDGFICYFCGKEYSKIANIEFHFQSVHKKLPHCTKCKRVLLESESHACGQDQPVQVCQMCDSRSRYSGRNLREHQARVHLTEPFCARCRRVFESLYSFEQHYGRCSKGQTPMVPCAHCPEKCHTRFHARVHAAEQHGSEPMCGVCTRFFTTSELMMEHLMSEHSSSVSKQRKGAPPPPPGSKGQVSCSECGAKFLSLAMLENHIKWSHAKKPGKVHHPFFCSTCKISFQSESMLSIHRKWVHKEESTVHKEESRTRKEEGKVRCTRCKSCFSSQAMLDMHVRYVHQPPKSTNKSKTCSVCKKSFQSTSNLTRHLRTHKPTTSERTNTKTRSTPQKPIESEPPVVFPCCYCKQVTFQSRAMLEMHTKWVHKSEGPLALNAAPEPNKPLPEGPPPEPSKEASLLSCSVCKATFQSRSMLDIHLKWAHKPAAASPAAASPAAVASPATAASTKGNRPCHLCEATFSNMPLVRAHLLEQHQVQPQCGRCHLAFPSLKLYDNHAKSGKKCRNLGAGSRDHSAPPASVSKSPSIASKPQTQQKTSVSKSTGEIRKTSEPSKSTVEARKTSEVTKSKDTGETGQSSTKGSNRGKKFCAKCRSYFPDIYMHNRSFHRDDPLCQLCTKLFNSKKALRAHAKTCGKTSQVSNSAPKRPYETPTPTPKRPYEYVLVDPTDKESTDPEEDSPTSKSARLECNICHRVLKTAKTFRYHMAHVHRDNVSSYNCTFCTKTYPSVVLLQAHMTRCQQTLSSGGLALADSTPPVQFPSYEQLDSPDSPYVDVEAVDSPPALGEQCVTCHERFISEVDVKIHENEAHNGTHLVCAPCKLLFAAIPHFVAHIHNCERSKSAVGVQPEELQVQDVMHIKREKFDSM